MLTGGSRYTGPKRIALGGLLMLVFPGSMAAAELKAGVSRVEITPPTGLGMYGYGNRKGGATGVLDPLMAWFFVLEAADKRLALVVMDLGEPLAVEWTKRLRQNAANGSVLIGHNRLRLEPDGRITWFERNNTMVPTSPVDPTVAVLRVDSAGGKPIAILVNYACHPVVFGSDNLQYSADYPGVMINTVERELGGQPLAMFLQGGDGDINPYYAVHPLDQDAVKMRDWTGERLGREAARVAKAIRTESVPDASLDHSEDTLDFAWRWNPRDSGKRSDNPGDRRPPPLSTADTPWACTPPSPPSSSTRGSPS